MGKLDVYIIFHTHTRTHKHKPTLTYMNFYILEYDIVIRVFICDDVYSSTSVNDHQYKMPNIYQ